MAYDFKEFRTKAEETIGWLKKELLGIQTGRATPTILDAVMVDSFGSKMHVNQVASITSEDARTLRIVPWDTDSIRSIEVAVRDADLGASVATDEKGLRVSFPELTTETREKFTKVVKKKLEEAKVSLRGERDEVWNDLQKQKKDGDIGEDDMFRFKEEMEKITKEFSDSLDDIAERKEKEIMG